MRQVGHGLGFLPLMELGELVHTHEEDQFGFGVLGPKMPQRVHGVRGPLPVQFHIAHPQEGVTSHRCLHHLQPGGGSRHVHPHLVGRHRGHHKEETVKM
jgi:hypothetical protein